MTFTSSGPDSIIVASTRGNSIAEAYLAHLEGGEIVCVEMADVPVVSEFQDVFDDILELPPDREIEFCIELMPGTAPIHRSPYRMALVETEELRRQIDELEERRFIRKSHSPWGAPVLFVTKKHGSQ